ncbi:GNAT family N-acetyltransferase [Paenibacillus tengchongensis]|uniref:GNAT family N-acetyltransferase n=1 Tax=Paenibacillus tengchongensis TaxID=2608684 RepID=UPI001651FB27|nr:GNAT family N-acetyltransferase [Paenibacillus tengchongensis]
MNRKQAIETVRKVLAADFACSEADLQDSATRIYSAGVGADGFRFPLPEPSLRMVTMGSGTVISCSEGRMEWARKQLGALGREQLFTAAAISRIEHFINGDNQTLAGPELKYVCSLDSINPGNLPEGIEIRLYDRSLIPGLYEYGEFRNALSYSSAGNRPDMLAAVAVCGGTLAGIAGASADSDAMWQVGVDVVPEQQGGGIGRALVGLLTQALLKEGILPYYTVSTSNLRSRQLAVSAGYWPAWTQLYARNQA